MVLRQVKKVGMFFNVGSKLPLLCKASERGVGGARWSAFCREHKRAGVCNDHRDVDVDGDKEERLIRSELAFR